MLDKQLQEGHDGNCCKGAIDVLFLLCIGEHFGTFCRISFKPSEVYSGLSYYIPTNEIFTAT